MRWCRALATLALAFAVHCVSEPVHGHEHLQDIKYSLPPNATVHQRTIFFAALRNRTRGGRAPRVARRGPQKPNGALGKARAETREALPKSRLPSRSNYTSNSIGWYRRSRGNEWRSELEQAATKFNRNNSIVLTGGDWSYRATVLNWMAHAENIGMTQYIVLCYGERMYNLVGSWEEGGHGILVRDCSRVVEYMFMKIVGMFHLHDMRYIVTWSDCDALWLKPFMDTWILPYRDEVDILGQKALHPTTISNRTGSCLCTGLFTVFPTNRSSVLMGRLLDGIRNARSKSDQTLVNSHLRRLGSYDILDRVDYGDNDKQQIVVIPMQRNSSKDSPKIGFLPSTLFPRSLSALEWSRAQHYDPQLWHSISTKDGEAKVTSMANESVFALRDGWNNITDASEVSSIIDKNLLRLRKWRQTS